jgi:hypothetical protein
MSSILTQSTDRIEKRIFLIRGEYVMLDSDLADIYGVSTSRLNEQVKRNAERFPEDFMFKLSKEEWENLISQNATSNEHGGRRKTPFVFTEQGVAGLSGVLKSEQASQVHVTIMRAFVSMRKLIASQIGLIQRIDGLERKQLETDNKFENVFKALEQNTIPSQGIFFDGQIYDAYELMSKIIRSAKKEIILIDNYIDETVLTHLSKRAENVEAIIYTKSISKAIQLDLERHNSQYSPIQIKELRDSHDRFLIIDQKELYHIGASLKDLGKKWFAFSKMDGFLNEVLKKIKTSPIQF